MEEWKDIPGLEGLYQVSSEGRVQSLDREVIQKGRTGQGDVNRFYKGKVLTGSSTSDGYRILNTYNCDQKRSYSIHRLVGRLFIPNPYGLPEIDHINRDKTDNRVSNLRWVTAKDNCLNRARNQAVI